MGLIYGGAGPSCFVTPDVRLIEETREHDIPYTGTCVAVVAPSGDVRSGGVFGMVFDSVTTLYVDELRDAEAIRSFKDWCASNRVDVIELAGPGGGPISCPPPPNQYQLEEWRRSLFQMYGPKV